MSVGYLWSYTGRNDLLRVASDAAHARNGCGCHWMVTIQYHREEWAHHGGESTEIYSGPSQMEKKRTKALHLRWRLRR
jgi:hypothetical protein